MTASVLLRCEEWMVARRRRRSAARQKKLMVLLVVVPLLLLAIGIGATTSTGGWWDRVAGWELPGSSEGTVAWVNTDTLNLRSAPSTTTEVVGTATFGDLVTIVGSAQDGFVPVEMMGNRGWMAEEYLTRDREPMTLASSTGVLPQDVVAAEPDLSPSRVDQKSDAPPVDEAAAEQEPVDAPQPGERWIEIDRSSATVTLHDGEIVVAVYQGRIGRDTSADGFYSTAVGTYSVYSMNKGLAPTPFAEDTYLTDWVGFDPVRKNGIHSPVRDSAGVEKAWQNQTTLGCVRLGAEDAVSVFQFAELGMRVEVRE